MNKLKYGPEQPDGSREITLNGKAYGVLRPTVSQKTLEASPGIQSWSHPRGKVAVKLWDDTSVARFADHWERKWRTTYPLASPA